MTGSASYYRSFFQSVSWLHFTYVLNQKNPLEWTYILSPLLRAVFLKPSKAEVSVYGFCSAHFLTGYKALLFEMPADPQEGNVENIPPWTFLPILPTCNPPTQKVSSLGSRFKKIKIASFSESLRNSVFKRVKRIVKKLHRKPHRGDLVLGWSHPCGL